MCIQHTLTALYSGHLFVLYACAGLFDVSGYYHIVCKTQFFIYREFEVKSSKVYSLP